LESPTYFFCQPCFSVQISFFPLSFHNYGQAPPLSPLIVAVSLAVPFFPVGRKTCVLEPGTLNECMLISSVVFFYRIFAFFSFPEAECHPPRLTVISLLSPPFCSDCVLSAKVFFVFMMVAKALRLNPICPEDGKVALFFLFTTLGFSPLTRLADCQHELPPQLFFYGVLVSVVFPTLVFPCPDSGSSRFLSRSIFSGKSSPVGVNSIFGRGVSRIFHHTSPI